MSGGGEHTDVVWKFYDSLNRGASDFDELVDGDIGIRQPGPKRKAVATLLRGDGGVMAAVPDSRWGVSDVLTEGDRVAIRITWSGTYGGAQIRGWKIGVRGKFEVEHIHIYHVAGGRLADIGWSGTTWQWCGNLASQPTSEHRRVVGPIGTQVWLEDMLGGQLGGNFGSHIGTG